MNKYWISILQRIPFKIDLVDSYAQQTNKQTEKNSHEAIAFSWNAFLQNIINLNRNRQRINLLYFFRFFFSTEIFQTDYFYSVLSFLLLSHISIRAHNVFLSELFLNVTKHSEIIWIKNRTRIRMDWWKW